MHHLGGARPAAVEASLGRVGRARRWGAGSVAGGVAAVLGAAFAAAIVASTLYIVVATHSRLPLADEWYSLQLFRDLSERGGWLAGLASAHNEHRLLFPRLVLFSDLLFCGGGDVLDIAAIFVVQAGATVLLLWQTRPGAGRAALGAVVVALMFSLRQSENFTWGFQVQFVGVFAAAALSATLFVAALAPGRGRARSAALAAGAWAASAVATFTMANGLLSGFVLLALAVLARAGARTVLMTAAGAAALVAAFAAGYQSDAAHVGLADTLRLAPRILFFAAAYLGNFLDGEMRAAAWLGAAGIAGLLALALPFALGRDRDPARLTLLGIALFAAISALVTAAGRAGDGLGGAMSSRYSTGAAFFWSAMLIAGWSAAGGAGRRAAWRIAISIAALVLAGACWRDQVGMADALREQAVARGAVEDQLLQGFYDEPALESRGEPVAMMKDLVPFLRARRLSIFADDAGPLGRPVAENGGAPVPCAGAFATAEAAPDWGAGAASVSGTSGLAGRLPGPRRILIAGPDGRVVGLARTGFAGPAWRGSATAAPGTALRAFAVSGSGRLCSLGTAVVAPARG